MTGHDGYLTKLQNQKADKLELKEIVDKIKQMDDDIENIIHQKEKLNTWVTWVEERVSGYSGPKGWSAPLGGENSAAFKELEENFWKLKWDYDEQKENNALMF